MNQEELHAKYHKPKVPHQWRCTDKISALICTFFGTGMLPKMPGSYGSLAAALVAYPLAIFSSEFWPLRYESWTEEGVTLDSYGFFLFAALVVFFAAIPFVKKAMRDTETEDPGWIVIDEVCGVFMALAFISAESILSNPWLLLVAFGVFRFFDILKPLGIHKFESFPGAWGVMADDLLGGVYSGIVLFGVVRVFGL